MSDKIDRELLVLAAKAIGQQISFRPSGMCIIDRAHSKGPAWNPLTDDGDAQRLAVKLGLLVDFQSRSAMPCDKQGKDSDWCGGEYNEDANADCRRAITRAAAEIGKAMP